MIGTKPSDGDFPFSHDGTEFAIGWSEEAEAVVLTSNFRGEWNWVLVEPIDEPNIKKAGGAVTWLQWFLGKVYEIVFGSKDETPPEFKSEMEKLFYLIANKLEYTPDGINIKN